MKAVFSTSLAAAVFAAAAAAAAAQRVVSLDIKKPVSSSPSERQRRDPGSYSQAITNNISAGSYYAEVTIGTPPQPITLIVDTGSSDTWVIDKGVKWCQDEKNNCLTLYDTNASSTVNLLNNPFQITYLDGSSVSGGMMKDTFTIGGATIKNLQMGLATAVEVVNSGILGLGLREGETSSGNYHNIMDVFYDQGLIGTRAFSLYLNAIESPSGTILFGGVDKEKFTGELLAVPLVPNAADPNFSSYSVALSSLSLTFDNGTIQGLTYAASAVLLDSGTTLTYLPKSTVQRIYDSLGVVEDRSQGREDLAWVDCGILEESSQSNKATFEFRFNGPDGPLIRVPLSEMVIDERSLIGGDRCMFGIMPANNREVYILGDTFLRSAYVVYDLANSQVALAQSKPNVTDKSDIVEFGHDATSIPEVSAAVFSGVTVTQLATGLPGGAGRPLPTVTVTGSGSNDAAEPTSDAGNPAPRSVPGPDWIVLGMVAISTGLGMLAGSMWLCLQS